MNTTIKIIALCYCLFAINRCHERQQEKGTINPPPVIKPVYVEPAPRKPFTPSDTSTDDVERNLYDRNYGGEWHRDNSADDENYLDYYND